MRMKTLALLAGVTIAGCGGGDSDGEATGVAEQPSGTQTEQSTTAPQKLQGTRNRANVQRSLGLSADGKEYTFGGNCKVVDFAFTESGVEELKDAAPRPEDVVTNDSGTAGVQLEKLSYYCAIQAASRLKNVP